jgi:hypothetical protein
MRLLRLGAIAALLSGCAGVQHKPDSLDFGGGAPMWAPPPGLYLAQASPGGGNDQLLTNLTLTGNLSIAGTTTTGNLIARTAGTTNVGVATTGYFARFIGQGLQDQSGQERVLFTTGTQPNVYNGRAANTTNNTTHHFLAATALTGDTSIAAFSPTNVVGGSTIKIHNSGKFGFPAAAAADVQGVATLVGGTVTVATTSVKTGDRIFTARNTTGGTAGHLNAPVASIVDATSFVINSSSGTDTSTVNWWIVSTYP